MKQRSSKKMNLGTKKDNMKRNWIRTIIGGLSFTSALFIFQACYGTPQDLKNDLLLEGQVKSIISGLPIKGIKVSVPDFMQSQLTDENGSFSIYTGAKENLKVQFEDVDLTQNGSYAQKDTIINPVSQKVFLNIKLENK
jgi:putative lipoprotein (rSAM/lipoprotein system)